MSHDPLIVRMRRDFHGETWLGWWLSLPWRCRLTGHRMALQQSFNENYPGLVEEAWRECERCQTFGGYVAGFFPESNK